MSPSFADFFKSYYYQKTRLNPIDLSDKNLLNFQLEKGGEKAKNIAEQAQTILSDLNIQRAFSSPLTYELEKIHARNDILYQAGFQICSKKNISFLHVSEQIAFPSVIYHDSLKEWIFKTGAKRISKEDVQVYGPYNSDQGEITYFNEQDNLLRVFMAQRISKIAEKRKIKVVIPEKKLVIYKNAVIPVGTSTEQVLNAENKPSQPFLEDHFFDGDYFGKKITEKSTNEQFTNNSSLMSYDSARIADKNTEQVKDKNEKYFIVCKKIEVLSPNETVQRIKKMSSENQEVLAKNLATIIKESGFVDANFENIRLNKEGVLAFIDTEPVGLMVQKNHLLHSLFLGPKGFSVEKCARIGLFTLLKNIKDWGLNESEEIKPFLTTLEKEYEQVIKPKISKWKVVLSIGSCGVIPLVQSVFCIIDSFKANRLIKKIEKIKNELVHLKESKHSISLGFSDIQDAYINQKLLEQNHDFAKKKKKCLLLLKEYFSCVEEVPITGLNSSKTSFLPAG